MSSPKSTYVYSLTNSVYTRVPILFQRMAFSKIGNMLHFSNSIGRAVEVDEHRHE